MAANFPNATGTASEKCTAILFLFASNVASTKHEPVYRTIKCRLILTAFDSKMAAFLWQRMNLRSIK
ncbi:hypothetical protein [Endozoicomonas sp. GU-1]|uniref:hypothetical protein n=1 Tax=Endozoicomonas sp. GU-1 TaxID=3009078 RepID=UPI0022B3AC22|nr:hypothetical protein [Endozoicomonas sp. GU-1]WBA80774.1 hypothetical protein O2T12_21070 [Endozoicomonas sp. GU-1]